MGKVEALIESTYPELKDVFRILPISTCLHSGGNGAVTDPNVQSDLNNISTF